MRRRAAAAGDRSLDSHVSNDPQKPRPAEEN
jgi:hypothetical protein